MKLYIYVCAFVIIMVRLVQELKGVCKEGSLVGSVGNEVDCQESRQCGENETLSTRS